MSYMTEPFRELTNPVFPCTIHGLYDEDDVSEIPGIDQRVLATETVKTRNIRDLVHPAFYRRLRQQAAVPHI